MRVRRRPVVLVVLVLAILPVDLQLMHLAYASAPEVVAINPTLVGDTYAELPIWIVTGGLLTTYAIFYSEKPGITFSRSIDWWVCTEYQPASHYKERHHCFVNHLKASTTYYFKASVWNADGTSFGNEIAFRTH